LMAIPALCDLAAIKKVQGQLHQAQGFYDSARQWLVERGGLDSRVRCPYEVGLADLLREWNRLDEALEHARTGIEYCQRYGVYSLLLSGYVALMRILQAQGDVAGALDALRKGERTMQTHYHRLAARIELTSARIAQWLAVGDVESAGRCAAACGSSELEQIALARLWLAQGRAVDAQRLLDSQLALAEAGGRNGRSIEILGVLALALEALGRRDAADAALSEALFLARPERHMRLFLDLGWPMGKLMERSAASAPIAGDYVRDLLVAFRQEREVQGKRVTPLAPTLVDSLTEREFEVLQLLAEGLSNKEISDRLVVAPSTVKQHLKNIYGKLDVHSRTQAVARGQELELF